MKVSVIVYTYAMGRFSDFSEAVDSVLEQSYDPIEVVIVVDGTEAFYDRAVNRYGDRENVRFHCNDENRGASASRMKGTEASTVDLVTIIDDDAVTDPERVAEFIGFQQTDQIAAGGPM